jgi:hypothetical protein
MRRVLMIAGAALLCAGPALADDVTIEKDTTTITKEVVPAEPHSGSTVATTIVAPEPPPPPQVEARPEPPRPGMAWMEGHWEWKPDRRAYNWTPGEFAEPPKPHAVWSPGHWQKRPDGWVWSPGRWS